MSRYQLLPPLTDEEYTELEADIVANGVLQPILVDEHGVVIDGHHRKQIAEKHHLRCPSIKCAPNLSEEQKRTLAVGVNVHRRHLSREQKRQLIATSLAADPHLSDRQHAERTGADHKTVGAVRSELEAGGEIPHHETRTGKDGVAQPAAKPAHVTTTTRTTESTKVERDIDLETGEILDNEAVPAPVIDYDRAAVAAWEDEVHPPRPEAPALSPEQQRELDLLEGDARTARYVQKAISNWPALYGLRSNPRRAHVLEHLCDSDLAYLADIERKLL